MSNILKPHRPLTFLHISDIHVNGPDQSKMLMELQRDVNRLSKNFALQPQIIIVSGDLTQRGSASEFLLVGKALDDLCQEFSLCREDVVMVPGNHDIDWEVTKKIFSCFENTTGALHDSPPYEKKWTNYSEFYSKYYAGRHRNGHEFSLSEPWSIFEFESLRTVFIGINSTWNESHLESDHYGCIGPLQLERLSNRLEIYERNQWLRIAVLHHNFDRENNDTSALRDVASFRNLILPHVNFVMHGHVHLGGQNRAQFPPVLATGTATLGMKERPYDAPNQYQLIQIWPFHYKRWARCYSESMSRWIGDCSVSEDGDTWQQRVAYPVLNAFSSRNNNYTVPATVIGFIDAGDSVAAITLLSKIRSTKKEGIFPQEMVLKQKFGLFNDGDVDAIEEKLISYGAKRDSIYYELAIIKIKMLSQSEKWMKVKNEIKILNEIIENYNPLKARGILHRFAISESILNGYSNEVSQYFDSSIDISKKSFSQTDLSNNQHSILTSKVLNEMSSFFCHFPSNKKLMDMEYDFAGYQVEYLKADYDYSIGQAFPMKSAIQCLFIEAAIYLYRDLSDAAGWNRLLAANLLSSRYIISHRAEGFAELLSTIYNPMHVCVVKGDAQEFDRRKKLRALLEAAMQTGQIPRAKFLKKICRESQLIAMSEIYDLVPTHLPTPNDWNIFRAFLSRQDNIFSRSLHSI